MIFKTLLELGYKPKVEEYKFLLWQGFKPTIPFYTKGKKNELIDNNTKLRDITYTPDFVIQYNGYLIIIEAKGMINDVYPYKRKMFRKVIEERKDSDKILLFEIYTKKQLLIAHKIIQEVCILE